MRILRPPRVFLSYARIDVLAARTVERQLRHDGFAVFVDTEDLAGGEHWAQRLVTELRRTDAVVVLLTRAAVESEWCRAEVYHALAFGKRVIPLRIGPDLPDIPSAFGTFLGEVHQLDAADLDTLSTVSARVGRELTAVRDHVRRQSVGTLVAGALLVAGTVWGSIGIAGRVNDVTGWWVRRDIEHRLTADDRPLPGATILEEARRRPQDRELLGDVLALADDASESTGTRLNALQLAGVLRHESQAPERWAVRDLNWSDGVLSDVRLVDVVFRTGTIDRLRVEGGTFANVVWGASPSPDGPGLTVSGSSFSDTNFHGGWFDGTSLVDTHFTNVKIRGTVVDLTSFANVTFVSTPSTNDAHTITTEFTLFENAVVVSRYAPPEPGVMDFGGPATEVTFRGVVFESVHFRGWMRPEWFEAGTFRNCVFPKILTADLLAARGNHLVDCSWRDESLD